MILIKLVVSQLNVWRKDIVIILSIGNHGNYRYFHSIGYLKLSNKYF